MIKRGFPIIIHLTIPVEDFFDDKIKAFDALAIINRSITTYALQECSSVILACNTAHILLADIDLTTRLKIVSIIEVTKDHIIDRGFKKVGLLGSRITLSEKLFSTSNNQLVEPTIKQIQCIERIIEAVIHGEDPGIFREDVIKIIDSLKRLGAERVILGCTELELIMQANKDEFLVKPLELTVCKILKR